MADLRVVRPRFRWAKAYKVRRTKKICRDCYAPCCSSAAMRAVLEPIEHTRIERRELLASYVQAAERSGDRGRPADGAGPRAKAMPGDRWGFRRIRTQPVLKKTPWGACVHFKSRTNRCSIYRNRPLCCRAYFCGRGSANDLQWKLLAGDRAWESDPDRR